MGDVDLFKTLVWDNLVGAALQWLFVTIPFLAWGPIGAVVTWIVMKFTDKFYAMVKLFISVELIVFRNLEFGKTYAAAQINLKQIAGEKGIDSQEFKDAHVKEKQALSNLVKFDPARLGPSACRVFTRHCEGYASLRSGRSDVSRR